MQMNNFMSWLDLLFLKKFIEKEIVIECDDNVIIPINSVNKLADWIGQFSGYYIINFI